LNKEMSALNNHISTLSTQASNAEQLAKQKEQKYASDQQASVKKVELSNTITECDEDLKKVSWTITVRNMTDKKTGFGIGFYLSLILTEEILLFICIRTTAKFADGSH
jgi:hypothetical protein